MAEETPVSPISEAVPPKANPLAAPATAHAATLKLKPVIRPAAGLKLPPKTGVTSTGLKPGLKLPPKTGVTSTGLKPGLKLPPKPGVTSTTLKPGVKLPARPVIRKPGEAPKPVAPMSVAPKPVTPESIAPAEPAPKPLETLKAVTQNLKSMTASIPQQAVLHKTGIIAAKDEMTEAQKQAAKSKTARISLSDAMGVAPVKNEALPMKTIRIKRPVDLPAKDGATSVVDTQAETKVAEAPKAAEGATTPEASFTQRKTLKIARPTSSTVRPTGKFAIRKPTAATTAAAPAAEGAPAEVADIPEMPSSAAVPTAESKPTGDTVPDVPKGVAIAGLIVQIAACLTIAFLGWLLYQDTQLPLYCGGCL